MRESFELKSTAELRYQTSQLPTSLFSNARAHAKALAITIIMDITAEGENGYNASSNVYITQDEQAHTRNMLLPRFVAAHRVMERGEERKRGRHAPRPSSSLCPNLPVRAHQGSVSPRIRGYHHPLRPTPTSQKARKSTKQQIGIFLLAPGESSRRKKPKNAREAKREKERN